MNKLITLCLLLCFSTSFSQVLLKDANTANAGTHPTNLVNADGTIYFIGNTLNSQNSGIYKTDGTAAGTQLIREPYPNADNVRGPYLPYLGNSNSGLYPLGSKVVFTAYGNNPNYTGDELWVSDGTNAGTQLLKDIYPGSSGSNPYDFVIAGTKVFFRANDGVNGTELWATDGTAAGTQLVRDTSPGSNSQYINMSRAKVVENKLYFTYYDATYGEELWVSDGTTAGTILLKDIFSGTSSSGPNNLTVVGSKLYFSAYDNINGSELWVTDGTTAGTQLVVDLFAGSNSSSPNALVELNGNLIFTAYANTNNNWGNRIYISDGTAAGTTILKDRSNYGPNPTNFTKIGNQLFFTNIGDSDVPGRELWVTDGTTDNTKLVKDINLTSQQYTDYTFPFFGVQFFDVNGKLFFLANSGLEGFELWQSDGTETGTTLIRDFVTGTISADYKNFKVLGNELYFIVNDSSGDYNCWKTDGTLAGTVKVSDVTPGANVQNLFPLETVGNTLYLAGFGKDAGYELYKTDGSTVSLVKDILQDATYDNEYVNLRHKTSLGNKLIYTYDDGLHGQELWGTNGFESTTSRITDLIKYPSISYYNGQLYSNYSDFRNLTELGNYSYFVSSYNTIMRTDGSTTEVWQTYNNGPVYNLMSNETYLYWLNGSDLYKSDGSTIALVKTLPNYRGYYSEITYFTLGNNIFFYYTEQTTGFELWKTDGTSAGTTLLKDINPGTNSSIYTSQNEYITVGNKVYFTASTNNEGVELWVTDGTTAGTQLVKDIFSGSNSSAPQHLTQLDANTLLFSANDNGAGHDLWKTDGTTSGTTKVSELSTPSNNYHFIRDMVKQGNEVYVGYYSGQQDILGKTDGMVLTQIKSNFSAQQFVTFNNEAYITGYDNSNYLGIELYKTDGTTAGTVLAKDINLGGNSSNPRYLYVHNNDLYFTADDGVHGNEVYILRSCADSLNVATTITGEETIKAGRIIVGETANTLSAASRVTYDAGNYILLKAGFSTEEGAVFTTILNGCANNATAAITQGSNSTSSIAETSVKNPVISAKAAQYLQDLRDMPTIEQFLARTDDKNIAEIYDRYQQATRPMLSELNRLQTELREIEKSERAVRTAEGAKNLASFFETKEVKTTTLREAEQSLQQQTAYIRTIRNIDGIKTGYELVIRLNGKEHVAKIDLPQ